MMTTLWTAFYHEGLQCWVLVFGPGGWLIQCSAPCRPTELEMKVAALNRIYSAEPLLIW